MIGTIFFWFFALAAFFLGVGVIVARSPMHSAISLIGTLVCLAGLFLLLYAEFLAWILLIVYAGAVMVLIVFVISLLNLSAEDPIDFTVARRWGLALLALFAAIILIYFAVDPMLGMDRPERLPVPEGWGDAQAIAYDLFTRYMIIAQLAGVLLTAAVIGAVMLARRPEEDEREESE